MPLLLVSSRSSFPSIGNNVTVLDSNNNNTVTSLALFGGCDNTVLIYPVIALVH